ncbi:hypothetical protein [Ostreibacterium oceani]|uniref:Uncharacterized protein n=1 Tax=Ostreibacterium oceani TaxID=2654998 RepID=A0A6N7EYS2_9GAMM|nr:hypothetical protein [Ostreibacterium oceani]MPV86529.1 hypothetical protein [Ostreibacterium oceani]
MKRFLFFMVALLSEGKANDCFLDSFIPESAVLKNVVNAENGCEVSFSLTETLMEEYLKKYEKIIIYMDEKGYKSCYGESLNAPISYMTTEDGEPIKKTHTVKIFYNEKTYSMTTYGMSKKDTEAYFRVFFRNNILSSRNEFISVSKLLEINCQ